jgi:hypothetical protein
MRRLAPLALALLVGVGGCSGRERSNPLDPGNPETGGQPVGFSAVAGNLRVSLRWRSVAVPELAGYILERRGPSDPDFIDVAGSPLPPNQFTYDDPAVANDSTYAYRLSFVLVGGARSEAASSQARPGPGALWVADAGNDRLLKLAPDGHVVTIALAAPDQPGWVRVEPSSGNVWTSSRTLGVVALWTGGGSFAGASSGFGAPGAVAPIPGTSSAWIAEERFGEVSRWNVTGGISNRADDLGLPSDVAVTADRGAWIADRAGAALLRITDLGAVVATVPLADRPWRVAIDPVNDELWVVLTEAGAVERRAGDGSLVRRIEGFDRPYAIALDTGRSVAWVVLAGEDAVIGLDRSGGTIARLAVEEPRGVAVDGRLGEVWVSTIGGEDAAGEVRRYGPTGDLRSTLGGFDLPFTIDFDPGR